MSKLHLLHKATRYIESWILQHRLWTILIAFTLLGVLAYKPAFKKWKQSKAHEISIQAVELMKIGKWTDATPLLEEAYKTNPSDPFIVRACVYYERHGPKNWVLTCHYLRQLVRLGVANSEDKAELSEALLEQGMIKEALEIFESIPTQDRNSAVALEVESQFMRRKGEAQAADDLLRKSLAMNPTEPRNQLKLAIMDMHSSKYEIQQQSLKALWTLARADSNVSNEAIEKIARHPLLTEIQSEELLDLLPKKNNASDALRYEVMSCHLRFHPKLRESILEAEIALNAKSSDIKFRYLCIWLIFEKEYDRALKLLTQDKAISNANLYPIYVETLARQGKWTQLNEFLKTKHLPTTPIDKLQLQARCAHELKEPSTVVREHLIAAQSYASAPQNSKALQSIGGLAEKLGYPDIAIDCLLGMNSKSEPLSEAMVEHILELQRGLEDLAGMITTLRTVNFSQRGTIALAELSVYLKILSGVELETVMDDCDMFRAQGIISADSYDFFKAFAAYRNGDLEALKTTLVKIKPSGLPVNWRAVYAGMLSSIGEQASAFQIGEKIQQTLIMQSEKKILIKAL